MTGPIRTLADLNERNRVFWDEQHILMEQRMANKAILAAALRTINSESDRSVPVYYRRSLESALEDAVTSHREFNQSFAIKGGTAKKTDLLQRLIQDIVQQRPNLTWRELLDEELPKFTTHAAGAEAAVIDDIGDRTISFFTQKWRFKEASTSGPRDDSSIDEEILRPTKLARISALKDRLSRAKKKIRSR